MSEAAELSEQHELEPSSPPRSVLASALALPKELPAGAFLSSAAATSAAGWKGLLSS